jgi:hypothetical protein
MVRSKDCHHHRNNGRSLVEIAAFAAATRVSNGAASSTSRPPKQLGLTIPQQFVLRADEVIE